MRSKGTGALGFIGGAAIGGGLMYLLDPDRGNRRRALVRDKAARAVHELGWAADKTIRDLQNRARGTVAETWSALRHEEVPDEVLSDRIRAKLGRLVSHPSAIDVRVENGRAVLSGPVLEAEVDRLVSRVCAVRGVRDIENQLQVHRQPGDVPGLQGGSGCSGDRIDLMQENWAPATRLLAGTGGALLVVSAPRQGWLGLPMGVAGGVLLLRSVTNLPVRSTLGLSDSRRGFSLQKTYEINAPVEEVYRLVSNPENFPQFMSRVKEVNRAPDKRFHWTVAGPAGISVSWDAIITEQVPNKVLAWSSVPGSIVRNAGIMHFGEVGGGTRLQVLISYNPPGGAFGHAFAALFGADPKHALEEDMVRLKSLFEHGKATGRKKTVTREQLGA